MHPIPVVRVIIENQGKILLLKRANSKHANGMYCLPGGKFDSGMTLEDAVRMENFEETGTMITNLRFLFYQDDVADRYFTMYFTGDYKGKVTLNEESATYVWMDPDKISEYDIAFGNDRAILRYLG